MVIANTLFDALVTANVPRDQAHAVVEALEHRMTSELATKADLTREISGLRAEMKADLAREIAAVKVEIAKLDAKITDLQLKLTIRMGAMMVATASLLFTAQQIFGR
jgi:septal ring factor EnvC (AmiA/AmiB activator)